MCLLQVGNHSAWLQSLDVNISNLSGSNIGAVTVTLTVTFLKQISFISPSHRGIVLNLILYPQTKW